MPTSASESTSDWQPLILIDDNWFEKEIITGCTISVIVFALNMNILVKAQFNVEGDSATASATVATHPSLHG